jgi:hypothetical protein
MRRRDFLSLVSSAAFACTSFAQAQPTGKTRRIGVLLGLAESDADARSAGVHDAAEIERALEVFARKSSW